jgi:hypothetical protein
VTLGWDPAGAGGRPPVPVVVGQVRWNAATGEPLLPERPFGWDGATAIAMGTDLLTSLEGRRLEALLGWVLGGGTLALSVSRPDDLRHPTMLALVGAATPAPVPPLHLLIGDIGDVGDDDQTPPGARRPPGPLPLFPGPDVAQRLRGFGHGNLHATRLGSTAAYGLGEVHLLPFDTGSPADVGDAWARGRLTELVQHAWDRRAETVVATARQEQGDGPTADIARELDPNDAARWAVGVAALLLVVYAIFAGPVNFAAATRSGRPLRALARLPVLSACAFLAVVALGLVARGVRGRARRLTLVDTGAGISRAAVVRWRGFYGPDARALTVPASSPAAVLRATGETQGRPRLEVDRDGARLVDVAMTPWLTSVVREDDVASLGAGLSVVPDEQRGAVLTNRIGRDLLGVLVVLPGESARFFPRLRDGASVAARDGEALPHVPGAPASSGGKSIRPLQLGPAADRMDEAAPGLAGAWSAVASSSNASLDWFPADVPVVLGQLEGGEGGLDDTGFPIEHDRALVHVVGWGGLP